MRISIFSNEDHVEQILNVHQRVPITVRGRTLRIEHAEFCPWTLSPSSLGDALESEKPPDPATCSSILKGLTQTVPRFRGLHNPSRVFWIGSVACKYLSDSSQPLTNFSSRLGCVVDIRLYG